MSSSKSSSKTSSKPVHRRIGTAALALSASLLLTACVDDHPAPDETAAEDQPHLLQAQEQALERARAVEDQVLEAAEQQRQAIDKQGGKQGG